MDINTFLGLCADAVRYAANAERKKDRLQTFAVLTNSADASTENLQKNITYTNSRFFFSRKWEALGKNPSKFTYEYPACFAFVLSTNTENPFNFQKHCYQVRLQTVYPNVDRLGDTSNVRNFCEAIPVEAIHLLMEQHLMSILYYLLDVVYANVDGVDMWHNRGYLDQAITDGEVTAYTVNEAKTKKFISMLRRENIEAPGGYIDDFGADLLCGVSKTINFCDTGCSTFTYSFDTSNCCVDYDS